MANVYGTKEYEAYLKEYDKTIRDQAKDRFEWTLTDTIVKNYKDYAARLDIYRQVYLFEECDTLFESARLQIEKNGKPVYRCENMYYHRKLLRFYQYNGQDYLLFGKNDLYGYTLLNLDTLEEHNYFPSAVIEQDESFIVTDGHIFGDILIFEGCFWAGPHICYLLDLKTFKTHCLGQELGSVHECRINGDTVTFAHFGDDDNAEPVTYRYDELSALLEKSENYDLSY